MPPNFDESHIGKRVIYTDRSGKEHLGYIRGLTGVSTSQFLDLKLDGSTRERFYVPDDACTLVPDVLSPLLGEEDDTTEA